MSETHSLGIPDQRPFAKAENILATKICGSKAYISEVGVLDWLPG